MRFLSNLLASALGTLLALVFLIFAFFLFIFAIAAATDGSPRVENGSVFILKLDGAIPELAADDPLAREFTDDAAYDLHDLTTSLRRAAADDRVEALWLRLGGFDASWATLQEVRDALQRFKESGKPVYASSDGYMMNEAGYFVASVADSIFADPQAMFEFNGFYLAAEFYQNLLEKVGIEPQVVRTGRYKGAVEPFLRTDLSPENEEQLSAMLSTWNSVFLNAVAGSRRIPVDRLQSILQQSAIVTAADAERAGLLDALLYHDQVESVIKARLGMDEDEDLASISKEQYKDVPDSEAGLERGGDGDVAIVYAVGAIVGGESGGGLGMTGGTVGAETFNKAMREARENERVKAVVVRVNSPGGFAPAADAMLREIDLTAETKPVIVSMGDYAASGGYWIAASADTIVAQPLTLTGSIGVFSVFFDASGLVENKLGITHDFIRTSPYADMFSGLRPLSERERAVLQSSTEQTYRSFVQLVARGRAMPTARVDSLGQGRVWTGAQAAEIGLVDVLGGLNTAVALAAQRAGLEEGSYGTRLLPRPKTFLEQLTQDLNARAAVLWYGITTSPLERSVLKQAEVAREILQIHGQVQARLPIQIQVQ